MAPDATRILGIDPGLQTTGYAVITASPIGPTILEAGVIRTTENRDTADMAPRLAILYDSIQEVLEQWLPKVMVVEQLYSHYEHPRTAILMGHARGMFFLAGGKRNIPVLSYPATRIKKTITGSGRASKEQMQYAIMREFNLAKLPEPHDVADAVAVALCHYFIGNTGGRRGVQSSLHTGVNLKALYGDDEHPIEDEYPIDDEVDDAA